MKTKTTNPELRFPDFETDENWKEVPLNSVATRIRKKVGTKKLTPVSITAGVGFVDQAAKFGRSIAGEQYKNYIHIKRGDFVYNKGNSKTFAQGCIYQLKEFDEAAASTAFICFELDSSCVDHYFQSLFECNTHGRQLAKFITSGARSDGLLNINPDDFFSIELPVPPTQAEQQKIAECLGSLDELIAAHSRKLTALQDHKKGLLQQLFPAEGETTPKLRFPGFENAGGWTAASIGKKCSSFSGGTPSSSNKDYYGGNIPFIRSAEIAQKQTALFLTEEGFSKSAAKMVKKGDVLVALYGANSGDVSISKINGAINQAILCLRSKESNSFIYHYLTLRKEWILRTYLQGGQGNLSGEIMKSVELRFPKPEEQSRIAMCLNNLDALITAQTEQIAALKEHKKGLMQQLFPGGEQK